MSSPRLIWTPVPSFRMTYAAALGYVFEVHGSTLPLLGPPSSYTVVCRHVDVTNGAQRTGLGEYGEQEAGQLAAEAWLVEQIAELGFAPMAPAQAAV